MPAEEGAVLNIAILGRKKLIIGFPTPLIFNFLPYVTKVVKCISGVKWMLGCALHVKPFK